MPTKVTDTMLPTTMIGSYPKPRWFEDYNVAGADLLEWWKIEKHFQAFRDATAACIKDQEIAELDIVTDGQMHFDQYGGAIGSVRLVLVRAARRLQQKQAAEPDRTRDRGER